MGCWMLSITERRNGDVWARWVMDWVYYGLRRVVPNLVSLFASSFPSMSMCGRP